MDVENKDELGQSQEIQPEATSDSGNGSSDDFTPGIIKELEEEDKDLHQVDPEILALLGETPPPTKEAETEMPTPTVDAPKEPEIEPEGPSAEDQLREQIGKLAAENAELLAKMQAAEKGIGEKEGPKVDPEKKQTLPEIEGLERADFTLGQDLNDIFASKESYNAHMLAMSKFILGVGMQINENYVLPQHREQIMQGLPQLLRTASVEQQTMQRLADDFYKEHPDLANEAGKQVVKRLYMLKEKEDPARSVSENLKAVAVEARQLLALAGNTKKGQLPRSLPGVSGGGRASGGSDLSKEIEKMFSV